MIGFPGDELTANQPIFHDIVERGLGGVILFNRCLHAPDSRANISSVPQLTNLCQSLRESSEVPLLIGVDQEGGLVRRLRPEAGFSAIRSAREMGEAGTEATAAEARTNASMLAAVGINCNFAPVIDIDCCPDNPVIGGLHRSFSAAPDEVEAHAAAWIAAHREMGLVSCVKHFPGHGSSTEDSHAGFVDISDTWHESELLPYRGLHERGLIDAVMTGHLFNHHIDPEFPATLSSAAVNGLLRGTIGYDGIVFSDDLQMRAITDRYPFEEAVCRTLAAGVDILVFGNNLEYDPHVCEKAIHAVINGVKSGLVDEQQIDNALRRVTDLKRKLTGAPLDHE